MNQSIKYLNDMIIIQSSFLVKLNISKLSQWDKEICDTPLQMDDYKKALSQLANDKSSGNDDLSTNFYKFFWPDICNLFIDSYNYSFNFNELS